jgi:hypothetical protein
MKKLLAGLLVIGSISAFSSDCTVSVHNFDTKQSKIEEILISKGYTIDISNPRFRIQSANYMGPIGEEIKIINVFERDNDNRVAYFEAQIPMFSAMTGGSQRAEKRYLRSLPNLCE